MTFTDSDIQSKALKTCAEWENPYVRGGAREGLSSYLGFVGLQAPEQPMAPRSPSQRRMPT